MIECSIGFICLIECSIDFCQSEVEQEDSVSTKRIDRRKTELVESSSASNQTKSLRTLPGQRLAFESSDGSAGNLVYNKRVLF